MNNLPAVVTTSICSLEQFWKNDKLWNHIEKWVGLLILSYFATMLTPSVNQLFGQAAIGEEVMKATVTTISIAFGAVYTLTFAILEFIGYLLKFSAEYSHVDKLGIFIVARIWCIIDHCIYGFIHIYSEINGRGGGFLRYLKWRLGGFFAAFAMHWLHNNVFSEWFVEWFMM